MQARLKVLHDKANVKQVKLLPVTLIGRSTECNLKIASSQVSRNHCRITLGTDAVFVEDLGSANGTLVDGQLIPPHQMTAIPPGARLVVGPAEFQIDYVAASSSTVVLPRTGVTLAPELPKTEMIYPPQAPTVRAAELRQALAQPAPASAVPVDLSMAPVAAAPAAIAAAVEPAAPAAAVEPAAPAAVAPATVAAAVVPAAVVPAAVVAPVVIAPVVVDAPVLEAAVAPPAMTPDAEFNVEESAFGITETEEEPESEISQFQFQETTPDTISLRDDAPAEPAPKKGGGLKSLFSMFGRKEKSAAAPKPTSSLQTAPATPSVFLPAMDAQELADTGNQPEPAMEPANADETTEAADETPQTTTDPDDGFQQFLTQL